MIEPQKAMFLYDPGTDLRVGLMHVGDSDRRGLGLYSKWRCSQGACNAHWRHMSDDEIYQCMHWLAIEMSEFAGVPLRNIRDMMAGEVRGFREYEARIGRMTRGPWLDN